MLSLRKKTINQTQTNRLCSGLYAAGHYAVGQTCAGFQFSMTKNLEEALLATINQPALDDDERAALTLRLQEVQAKKLATTSRAQREEGLAVTTEQALQEVLDIEAWIIENRLLQERLRAARLKRLEMKKVAEDRREAERSRAEQNHRERQQQKKKIEEQRLAQLNALAAESATQRSSVSRRSARSVVFRRR